MITQRSDELWQDGVFANLCDAASNPRKSARPKVLGAFSCVRKELRPKFCCTHCCTH